MTEEQLTKLLSLYKKAVRKNLTYEEFSQEVKNAKIQIDKSFVESGKKDMKLEEYLYEINHLRDFTNE